MWAFVFISWPSYLQSSPSLAFSLSTRCTVLLERKSDTSPFSAILGFSVAHARAQSPWTDIQDPCWSGPWVSLQFSLVIMNCLFSELAMWLISLCLHTCCFFFLLCFPQFVWSDRFLSVLYNCFWHSRSVISLLCLASSYFSTTAATEASVCLKHHTANSLRTRAIAYVFPGI